MSSGSASPSPPKTPSPVPESPVSSPQSPSKSPKKRNGVDKEEAKRLKEAKKAEEKADKWRNAQVTKIQKIMDKQETKAKDLCEKLSATWDPYGHSANQIRLLEAKVISSPEDLERHKELYENGPEMMKDFIKWVQLQFGIPEEKVPDQMEVDVPEAPNGTANGDTMSDEIESDGAGDEEEDEDE